MVVVEASPSMNSNRLDPGPAARRTCLTVVLGAGEGTRMCSTVPKVLHELAGRSMLAHVLAAIGEAGTDRVAVIIGPDHERVAAEARSVIPGAEIRVQAERLGTAHAVLAAGEIIAEGYDEILVCFADTPLVRPESFRNLRGALAKGGHAVVVLGFEASDPRGYGRLVVENGTLVAITEERDASPAERALTLCNAGLMALDGRRILALLEAIGNANAKGEYYLTDCVAVAAGQNLTAGVVIAAEDEVMGVNDRVQLAEAESLVQRRLRDAAMLGGVTMRDPSSVTLSHDTRLGRDVVIEPHVVFGPGVAVGDRTLVRSFSHLEGATVGPGATIGPFARLRPGARLADGVHIGNFVEVKAADVGAGAKINHLSYIGDASVGARTNIGAGTITCNYDGFAKYRTEIGEAAFIGSNSALVAPVKIGSGAYIASGSVITEDVESDSLALGRSRQVIKPGWAKRLREKQRK
jgi:bifunctional UDP-N-acetylglucosamine pyrophosphorylase/glucosamine-1-phosphate N-acetyltransferase